VPLFPYRGALRSTRRTEYTARITEAEAVAFTGLVPHVAGLEVAFKAGLHGYTLEHLHAIRRVSHDEECIRVSQVVIDCIALRHHSHVADSVDIVVSSTNTECGLQDTVSSELEFLGDYQFGALYRNLQTTLVSERSDVNQSLLKRSL